MVGTRRGLMGSTLRKRVAQVQSECRSQEMILNRVSGVAGWLVVGRRPVARLVPRDFAGLLVAEQTQCSDQIPD